MSLLLCDIDRELQDAERLAHLAGSKATRLFLDLQEEIKRVRSDEEKDASTYKPGTIVIVTRNSKQRVKVLRMTKLHLVTESESFSGEERWRLKDGGKAGERNTWYPVFLDLDQLKLEIERLSKEKG